MGASESGLAGASALDLAYGDGAAEQLQGDRSYGELVRFVGRTEVPAILDAYDWAAVGLQGTGTVVDIGGGYGELSEALHLAHPKLRCINFDLPGVIAEAPAREGVSHVAGDMFDTRTIPECDVLLMKHVLADWSDENPNTNRNPNRYPDPNPNPSPNPNPHSKPYPNPNPCPNPSPSPKPNEVG